MNNTNTVKIGTALKWRSTFDPAKRYYQENITTACGCVFRCKVLMAQGKIPVEIVDEVGHIGYTNTDVWDVVLDMAYYYNFAVDSKLLSEETLRYIRRLEQECQSEHARIDAVDAEQWKRIEAIEKLNTEQQIQIDALMTKTSCYSEGIWFDNLPWSDDILWVNSPTASIDEVNVLEAKHDEDVKAIRNHLVSHEEEQRVFNQYFSEELYNIYEMLSCFSSGEWRNNLFWTNNAYWENSKDTEIITTAQLHQELITLQKKHEEEVQLLREQIELLKSGNGGDGSVHCGCQPMTGDEVMDVVNAATDTIVAIPIPSNEINELVDTTSPAEPITESEVIDSMKVIAPSVVAPTLSENEVDDVCDSFSE